MAEVNEFCIKWPQIPDELKDMFLKNNDESSYIIKKGTMSISIITKTWNGYGCGCGNGMDMYIC